MELSAEIDLEEELQKFVKTGATAGMIGEKIDDFLDKYFGPVRLELKELANLLDNARQNAIRTRK